MKKRFLLFSLLVSVLFVLSGCGSKNKLVGAWKGLTDGETRDMEIETTFTFKEHGDVSYSNEYGITSDGTYEIKDDKVVITLKTWTEAKTYEFKVDGDSLSLTATDKYSPSYSEMKKQ